MIIIGTYDTTGRVQPLHFTDRATKGYGVKP